MEEERIKAEVSQAGAQSNTGEIARVWNSCTNSLRETFARLTTVQKQDMFANDPYTVWDMDPGWVMRFVRLRELTDAQEVWLRMKILELHDAERKAFDEQQARAGQQVRPDASSRDGKVRMKREEGVREEEDELVVDT